MQGPILCLLILTSFISSCITAGPFNPEPEEEKLSPKPNYQYDGKKTLFREGDIVGNPQKSKLAGEAAIVGKAWPNARIPYVIDCSLKKLPSALDALQEAIKTWQDRTCIRFVHKEESDEFFVTFLRSAGCWASHVGFHRRSSMVSIGNGCEYKHVMVHELGHVIGFWHEQSRPDRDNFVSIVKSNILPSLLYNFDKVTGKTESHGEEYDFESIMHYPFNAFAINRQRKTLIPLQDLKGKQPYVKLSDSDVIQANKMYKCGVSHDAPFAEANVKNDECIDEQIHCPDWARYNHCESNPEPLLMYCRKSCKNCGPCVDQPWCPRVYDFRFCVLKARTSLRECKALCGVCKPDPTPAPTLPPKTTPVPPTPAPLTPAPLTPAPLTPAPLTPAPLTPAPLTPAPTLPPTDPIPVGIISEIQLPAKKYIGIICVDRSTNCVQWKKSGRCEKDAWVIMNCLVSCNRIDICDVEALKPIGSCAKPLGLSSGYKDIQKIPDNKFRASSFFRPGGGWLAPPKAARLYLTDDHTTRTVGAWCANPGATKSSWLEIDLGKVKRVTGVATQGRDVYFEHVRSYEIAYKERESEDWKTYSIAGETKVLTGNCDHFTPVLNILQNPITARFVRLYPKTYRGAPCLRVELYGCDA